MGAVNISKIWKTAIVMVLVINFFAACGVIEMQDESWKNGCEPAIQNVNLNGAWPTGTIYGSIEISNFSWKEFDASVPSMGKMHFVLTDPVMKGALRYKENNGRYASIQLIGEKVWIQIMEYSYPSDGRTDMSISGVSCQIDYHILHK